MSEHIIEVRSEDERRQHQRRREDPVRTLEQERSRTLGIMAAIIAAGFASSEPDYGFDHVAVVNDAEEILSIIEKRERERQGKDESK